MDARGLVRGFAPISKLLAGTRVFPLWGVLRHTGRTSGKVYATPVVALKTQDGFIIPLPFGEATQWIKNLAAAGGGAIRHAGREHKIGEPRTIDSQEAAAHLPGWIRAVAARFGIRQWVLVRRVSS
jgi:deazaflavin-dependent oxidoreductase (nitroreductase family)